jgi:hypothetical protein
MGHPFGRILLAANYGHFVFCKMLHKYFSVRAFLVCATSETGTVYFCCETVAGADSTVFLTLQCVSCTPD